MFTRDTPQCGIDTVYCAELRLKKQTPDGRLLVQAKMVYSNGKTGATFGTCPLLYDSAVHGGGEVIASTLSAESIELITQLQNSLEKDHAKLVFEHGHTAGSSGSGKGGAETGESISKAGLGGVT
jgi:hypothetical protein